MNCSCAPQSPQGINLCPIPALSFAECPTGTTSVPGTILTAQLIDFTPALTTPYWGLGFEMLGYAYPYAANVQQAFYYNTLLTYGWATLAGFTTAQFSDQYATTSGLVRTRFQVNFLHATKQLQITNLQTWLPQATGWRACAEILLARWTAIGVQYSSAPTSIPMPFTP